MLVIQILMIACWYEPEDPPPTPDGFYEACQPEGGSGGAERACPEGLICTYDGICSIVCDEDSDCPLLPDGKTPTTCEKGWPADTAFSLCPDVGEKGCTTCGFPMLTR